MYLDSAIIVKLLVPEPDSPIFVKVTKGQPIASSELALTEVASALSKNNVITFSRPRNGNALGTLS
jgi:predicted nucleic acid-binding protein